MDIQLQYLAMKIAELNLEIAHLIAANKQLKEQLGEGELEDGESDNQDRPMAG